MPIVTADKLLGLGQVNHPEVRSGLGQRIYHTVVDCVSICYELRGNAGSVMKMLHRLIK